MQHKISSCQEQTDETMSRMSDDSVDDLAHFEYHGVPSCFPKTKELHPHQHESLKWMSILYHSEVNGILADDMVSSLHLFHHSYDFCN